MDSAGSGHELRRPVSRRDVLRAAGALGASLAAGGLLGCQPPAAATPQPTEADRLSNAPTTAAQGATVQPTAGAAAQTGSSGAKPFTMFVYSGLTEKAYRELFVPGFEAQSGSKVSLDPGWWDMAAKLKVTRNDQAAFDL